MLAKQSNFWTEAFALHGSATPRVMPRVLIFGALATLIYWAFHAIPGLHVEVAPYEAAVVGSTEAEPKAITSPAPPCALRTR